MQLVVHMADAQLIRNISCVVFGIGLEARVGKACGPAFVEEYFAADSSPAFWKHAICGEFWRGDEFGTYVASVSGKCNLRKYAAHGVVVEVRLFECVVAALMNNPVAVVKGKPFANIDDSKRPVGVQSISGEKSADKRTILRNSSMPNP